MTLTVIDVGCADHGGDQSVRPLIEEFHPDRLLGFDPELDYSVTKLNIAGTSVELRKRIAWVKDGSVEFVHAGLGTRVEEGSRLWVRCDNLGRVIREELVECDRLILKMDAEMSEYQLLPVLIEQGLDERIELLLIEWHCPECRNGDWSHNPDCSIPANPLRDELARQWRGNLRSWTR